MNRLIARIRQTDALGVHIPSLLALALVISGFGAFFLSWKGAAGTLLVPEQIPYLVSGGIGGFGLIIAGTAILLAQTRRRQNSREYRQLGKVLTQARAILETINDEKQTP